MLALSQHIREEALKKLGRVMLLAIENLRMVPTNLGEEFLYRLIVWFENLRGRRRIKFLKQPIQKEGGLDVFCGSFAFAATSCRKAWEAHTLFMVAWIKQRLLRFRRPAQACAPLTSGFTSVVSTASIFCRISSTRCVRSTTAATALSPDFPECSAFSTASFSAPSSVYNF